MSAERLSAASDLTQSTGVFPANRQELKILKIKHDKNARDQRIAVFLVGLGDRI